MQQLVAERRAIQVRIAGSLRYLAIEDAGRVRDALGTALDRVRKQPRAKVAASN